MRLKIILIITCLSITGHGIGQPKSQPSPPAQLNDGIKTSGLTQSGINASVIKELSAQIASGIYPNIHSFLIYKNDRLVFEKYFPGKDQKWGDDLGTIQHSREDLHDVRSISKSVVSACIGIAIAQKKIKSVEQNVFDFFPEYASYDTGMKKKLVIKDLLTMTSGIEWNEQVPYDNPLNSEIQMDTSSDPIGFVLSRPIISEPGKFWNYNGGTTEVLARIIEKVTGKKIDEFARSYLFKPLGIESFDWTKFPGTSTPAAASGLRLRSRDLLKFGILYHQKGKWNNKQIIPGEWTIASLQTMVSKPGPGGGYGYLFWTFNDSIQNKPIFWAAAVGNGDQRIYFDEINDLLVVITAGNYNQWTIKNNSYAILKRVYESFVVK